MDSIKAIQNYISFLVTECGLSVTLHPMEREELITPSELMLYNSHDNAYCTCVKTSREGHAVCVAQQKKVLDKCHQKGDRFGGVCHAGVFEYVYPISNGEKILGFVSVGGYQSERFETYLRRTAEQLSIPEGRLRDAYHTLKPTQISAERVDTLIIPLCRMLELAYRTEESSPADAEQTIHRILRYVQRHYDTDITSQSLCREFSCSRSYLSHMFRNTVGKGFRAYLIDLRLEHAKHLLTCSGLTVTEIAFSVGFNDSNYFSDVFKRKTGKSPLCYRKTARK